MTPEPSDRINPMLTPALPRLKRRLPETGAIDRLGWTAGACFVSYGVRIGIRANRPEVLEELRGCLPPGSRATRTALVDRLYSVWVDSDGAGSQRWRLAHTEPAQLEQALDRDKARETFEWDLHWYIAQAARRRIFLHAGVVGWQDRAIVLPGHSFAGKTTLVAALVRAGATYYSDEYAVFDAQGRVHPFPRPLSIRDESGVDQRLCPVEEMGGRAGDRPLPVGLLVMTEYRPGARWRPRRLSSGQAALAALEHTVPARTRPAAALGVLQQVVSQAQVLKGARGDAEEMARALIDSAGDWTSAHRQ